MTVPVSESMIIEAETRLDDGAATAVPSIQKTVKAKVHIRVKKRTIGTVNRSGEDKDKVYPPP